jgi:hypothetical protein
MKFYAMGLDANGRSNTTTIECKVHEVSPTESISNKQDGIEWRMGWRQTTTDQRTKKSYDKPTGPYEMHLGGPPHFVAVMAGHNEITMQDGISLRLCPGEFHYVRPAALHHSNILSDVPVIIFNLLLPGTNADIGDPPFK